MLHILLIAVLVVLFLVATGYILWPHMPLWVIGDLKPDILGYIAVGGFATFYAAVFIAFLTWLVNLGRRCAG